MPLDNTKVLSENDSFRLLHELQVHQIELEMQNEELKLAKEVAEVASQKYTELYDFAPSGYFTLSKEGEIMELNFSGAHMLGKERLNLMNSPFSLFISPETKPIYNLFLKNIFNNRSKETCEVTLSLNDTKSIYVYLTGIVTQNEEQCVLNAVDISDRKQAEEALREIEEHNHDIIMHTSMDGFWMFDKNGFLLEVNDTYCRMSGYNMKELLSMRISDLAGVEALEYLKSHMKKVLLQGETRFETRHQRKDGSIFDVEVSIQSRPVDEGQFVAFIHDITERKKAEELVIINNGRLNLALQAGNMAWWEMNIITGSITFEKAKAEILGYLPENFKHYSDFMKLVHPEDSDRAMDAMRSYIYGSANKYEVEYRIMAKSGEYKWFYDIGSITEKDANGKAILVTGLVTNITERKQSEQILKESEKRRLAILQTAMDGYWLLDMHGALLEVNETYCQMSGYSKQELLSMHISDLENNETAVELAARIQNIVEFGEIRFDTCHRRKDGSIFDIEASVQFQPVEGGQLVVFMHDITERKHSQEALIENERLLRESQAAAHIGSYSADLINKSWKASPEIYKIFGIDESYSHTLDAWVGAIHPDFNKELTNDLYQVKEGVKHFEHEYKIIRINDNVERWIYGFGEFEYDNHLTPYRLVGTIQDITDRKIKEVALLKLNKAQAAHSKSSQAMAQSIDEAKYLQQVCQIVVDDTDFAMVWIGFAQDDVDKSIRPMASAGFRDDYIKTLKLSWDDSAAGRGPAGVAVRTGAMCLCNNIHTDPNFELWREEALKRGYHSSIVFPLKTGDKTFGVISIYSKEPELFLDDEIKLLSELANDLAHGITTLRLRAAHQLAEDALSKSHSELEVVVKKRTHELQISNDLLKKEINNVKQKKQSLKLAEEKYRTVADHTHSWEFWLDRDNKFLYCSPSCQRITGYKASEFLKKPELLLEIIHPEDKASYQNHQITDELFRFGHHELEYRILRSDKSIRWIGHECQSITDESGNFIGIRGSNRDITSRKVIEQLLKTNNEKYRLLSENITDGIFICIDGCFEYVNKAMNHIFGYEDYKMEGLMLTQLALIDYHEALQNIITINSPVNQLRKIEIECSKRDHSIIYVEILINYIAKDQLIYGVVHDISDKKQIQKNIVKAIILTEEKERAYFSKELHDGLGPLLSTIKLYLQWSERPKTNQSRVEIIHKAEEILEEALVTVKEISNRLSPHLLINHGLASAIQSFVDKLEDTSVIKIDFECNVNRRLGNEIEAAFYRAVIECINNTIKYAGATNISIMLKDTGRQLQLQYRDDGRGFDLKETLALKKGLGLFNLQNRVETIGGKITMATSPGRGVDYQIVVNL